MRMNLILSTLALSIAMASAGCGGAIEDPDTVADDARTTAPIAFEGAGPANLVADALAEVPLSSAQRAEIEKLGRDAVKRHAQAREARRTLALAFADQLEAGAIDEQVLEPFIDAAATAAEATRPEDRAAIQRLHELLDGEQREGLVEALEEQLHERAGAGRWRQNLSSLAEKLALTDEQKDQIRSVVRAKIMEGRAPGELRGRWEHGKEALRSFQDDDFDLDRAVPTADLDTRARGVAAKVVSGAREILPILTQEQRRVAASELRARVAELP